MHEVCKVVNEETGEVFEARLLRRGSRYGRASKAIWDEDEPGLEITHRGNREAADATAVGVMSPYFLSTLADGPPDVGLSLFSNSARLTLTADNRNEIVRWGKEEARKPWIPPPPPPRPASQLESTRTRPNLADIGERPFTIYSNQLAMGHLGMTSVEVSWFRVSRGPDAQYQDAFHVEFLPRGKQQFRKIIEYKPSLVILVGWDHPNMVRNFQPGNEVTTSSGKYRWVKIELYGREDEEEEFEKNFAQYLKSDGFAYVLCDFRGEKVNKRISYDVGDSTDLSVILDSRNLSRSPSMVISPAKPERPRVFVSYFAQTDSPTRYKFESDFGPLIESASVYSREIESSAKDERVRRTIRPRIGACDALIVLVSRPTFTRKWVDWEIRTALDARISRGRKPTLAILTPELAGYYKHFIEEIAASQPIGRQNTISVSNTISNSLLVSIGFTIPARLLDNLLSGYASLHQWPNSDHEAADILSKLKPNGPAINSRVIMKDNLSPPDNA